MGQMAPADAVSREQCSCYPGFGGGGSPDAPCTICPAGTYARGGDLEACAVSCFYPTNVTFSGPKYRVQNKTAPKPWLELRLQPASARDLV